MKQAFLFVFAFVLGCLATVFFQSYGTELYAKSPDLSQNQKVSLDLFVMSQCPYGVQAENGIKPVLDKLSGYLSFNLNFIGSGTADNLQSLHGENEVKGNMIQICAKKYSPEKYFDFILCMNENPRAIPGNWEECAKKTGLDVADLKKCYEGDEGKKLLEASFKASESAGADASPTIIINGEAYEGKRDEKSLLRVLCSTFGKNQPKDCLDIPKPVEHDIIVLSDKNCETCDASELEARLKQIFSEGKFSNIDISSPEGKKLVEDLNIEKLPAFIFDAKVAETDEWKSEPQLQSAFEKKKDEYVLKDEVTGATYFIDAAKRQAYEQQLKEAHLRTLNMLGVDNDNKPQVDFFVMSYCPYGNQAEETIKLVYDLLKDNAAFNPHYVIYKNYRGGGADFCREGYCSMHGIQELNQNIREMCVNKYYGIKGWFDFAIAMNGQCNYQNADTCWSDVAKKLNLDVEKIKTCEAKEGVELVKKEYELNQALDVQGSPTTFIEGNAYEGQRTPAAYQLALCSAFKNKPADCEKVVVASASLSQPSAPAGGGCGT